MRNPESGRRVLGGGAGGWRRFVFDQPGEDGGGEEEEEGDDGQHVARAPGHAARPVEVAAVAQDVRGDEQQKGDSLPAMAAGEGQGAQEAQQQHRRIPKDAAEGADGQAQPAAQHALRQRAGKLRVGGEVNDVARKGLDPGQGRPLVDLAQQDDDGQRNGGRQHDLQPCLAQAAPRSGIGRPAPFAGEGQQQQRRKRSHADLLGGEGQARGRAGQSRPEQAARRRRPVAQQGIDRDQIRQHGQRLAEEDAAVGPGQRGKGVNQRAQRRRAAAIAQFQEAQVEQRDRSGGHHRVKDHHPLQGCAQAAPPQVEGNGQDHLRRLVVGHHLAVRGLHGHVAVVPVDLVDLEVAALDQAVDAAEQRALVGTLGRPQEGDQVNGQRQEENAHCDAPILAQLGEVLSHGAIVPRRACDDKIGVKIVTPRPSRFSETLKVNVATSEVSATRV